MNVSEITFGVEFEVILPVGTIARVGHYHNGIQIPDLPEGWNAQGDGSIRVSEAGHVGVEVVSPILKGLDGIRQVKLVCLWLQQRGAKVNRSTGFHVHVGFGRTETEGLKRLVSTVANYEKALFAATGTKAREQGIYCRGVQNDQRMRTEFTRDGQARAGHIRGRSEPRRRRGTAPPRRWAATFARTWGKERGLPC